MKYEESAVAFPAGRWDQRDLKFLLVSENYAFVGKKKMEPHSGLLL
jgi:hypothetical protein